MRTLIALPVTLLGVAFALLAERWGTRVQLRSGVLEVWGPGARRILERAAPEGWRIRALTLGHVVLARDRETLASTRAHERQHVRQYERWGVALLPAYLLAGLAARLSGGDPYRDGAFERAARGAS